MALTDRLYIYKLTDKGRKMGRHTLSLGGQQIKIDKYGVIKVPYPGIPNFDAHDLRQVGIEGDGHGNFVDPDLVAKHQAIKDAEDAVKEAEKALAEAKETLKKASNDKKADAEANVKAAEALLAETKELLAEVKAGSN